MSKAAGRSKLRLSTPVEIALKKLVYRAGLLKVRDIFDIAVVDTLHHDLLYANLHRARDVKQHLVNRLATLSEGYLRQELAELDILEDWKDIADECLTRTRTVIEHIPAA